MRMRTREAMLIAGIFFAGASSASAASPKTRAFLANVVPNVDFLDRSSRFALTNSKSPRLRAFARSEAREQTLAANAFDEWMEQDAKPVPALADKALDRTVTGTVAPRPGRVPLDPPPAVGDERLALGQEDLDSLEGLEGRDFDDLYKAKQKDALHQVETDYQDYVGHGDVPALKTLAVRELPKVRRRLAQLGKL